MNRRELLLSGAAATVALVKPSEEWLDPLTPVVEQRLGSGINLTELAPIEQSAIEQAALVAINNYETAQIEAVPTKALSAVVAQDCGALVSGASVVASFTNGDAPVILTGQNGHYSGTWQPSTAGSCRQCHRSSVSGEWPCDSAEQSAWQASKSWHSLRLWDYPAQLQRHSAWHPQSLECRSNRW